MTTMMSTNLMINLHARANDGKNEGGRNSGPVFRVIALLSQHNACNEELNVLHLRARWTSKAMISIYN